MTRNILIATLILVLLIVITYFCCNNKVKENWEDYKMKPLNYMHSGSSPLSFYRRDRYRKPYRYPLKHYESSPIPHMSYDQ